MFDVKRIKLIARREWRARVQQRSFRVATGVMLLFVVVAASVPTVIAYFVGDDDETTTIAVVDEAGISAIDRLAPYLLANEANGDSIALEPAAFPADDAQTAIDRDDADAALVVRRGEDGQLTFTYVNDDGEFDVTAQRIYAGVAAISLSDRLAQAGVSEEQFQQAAAAPDFSLASSSGETGDPTVEVQGPELFVAFLLTIVMFTAIQLYGNWIAQGVVEEKSSRIMEIMINAATPRDLLAGKVIGIGLAALTQFLPMLIAGGLAFALQPRIGRLFGVETGNVFDAIDFGALSVRAVAGFFFYFLVGFILFAALYAGIASTLSRQEDISQATGPLMIFMLAGYLVAFFAIPVPDSLLARIVSIFPLTSPFNMPSRLVVTDVPAWELALSVALLLLTAAAGLYFAARVYRFGVLLYGQNPGFKALIRSRDMLKTSR